MVALSAGDFSTAETAGNPNFDTQGALFHGDLDSALHCTTERNAALELGCYVLRYELSIHVRVFNLNDVNFDLFTASEITDFLGEIFNLLTSSTNDNAWTGGVDRDANTIPSALDDNP
jgi:hypothetical protein